ncbi:MAG: type IV pili twitching motility protein PilT, partial [[Clostridium] innocuum]
MNELLESMIAYAREHGCSDIHLNVGGPAMIRRNGILQEYPAFINDTQTTEMILSMVDDRWMEDFK